MTAVTGTPGTPATTDHAGAAPLAAFDGLLRGDPAPDWIATAVHEAWSLDPTRTEIRLIAVSENATFRVDVDDVPYAVLRVHRPGHVGDTRQIEGELTWVRRLADECDVTVPDVVPTTSGALVLTVDGAGGTRWFCVAFAFVTGEILEDLADPRPYYAEIGAITARLHDHQAGWSRPDGFTRFSWTLGDMLGTTSRWGDWRDAALTPPQREVLEAAESAALAELADIATDDAGWGLVHADLRPSNIMIHEGALTVIDFDDCGFSWLLYDFAAALSFIEHEPYASDIARSWVTGYRTVRTLSARDLEHAAALSMVRRLTMLGWTTTHRADALPAELWDAQIPGSVLVARRYLENRTWLFA
ncbi:phosphotransferase enzyme family protein [Myceligenerans indicum]|uniref:Phosphotransferase n=1 Tax=Myceligenerans indicum TaxID=2593663 RepID=A0ABS1LLI5_9MICO|nr:phosphotransferase [Myceligenerans indicum]MBL0887112.1 phosphotransferase [Myceligenerans indicum]